MSHTPGPWKYVPDDGTGTLPAVLSKEINAGGNYYVAQCRVDADARLISAAPDLLSTCKQTMEELRRLRDEKPKLWDSIVDPGVCNAWDAMKAAIAKAEGTP